MLELETSKWQTLMNTAYAKWKEDDNTKSYDYFLGLCSGPERQAVLLGNMNYQIGNGGITQWVFNGYAVCYPEILKILKRMDTPRALEWMGQLKPFVLRFVDSEKENRGCCGSYLLDGVEDEEDEEGYRSEYQILADKLDEFYYREPFNAEFLLEVEAYLTKLGA